MAENTNANIGFEKNLVCSVCLWENIPVHRAYRGV